MKPLWIFYLFLLLLIKLWAPKPDTNHVFPTSTSPKNTNKHVEQKLLIRPGNNFTSKLFVIFSNVTICLFQYNHHAQVLHMYTSRILQFPWMGLTVLNSISTRPLFHPSHIRILQSLGQMPHLTKELWWIYLMPGLMSHQQFHYEMQSTKQFYIVGIRILSFSYVTQLVSPWLLKGSIPWIVEIIIHCCLENESMAKELWIV